MPRQFGTYDVCGVRIAAVTPEQAAEIIVDAAATGERLEAHLCNSYTLSLLDRDERLRASLNHADLNLPDGVPVAMFGRRAGLRGPVRGPSLVTEVARQGVPHDIGHYLYGGAPGVAEAVADELRRQVPGCRIVGYESPPYRDVTESEFAALVRKLESSQAGVVWIGLGTPKQDYLVPRLAERLAVAVVPVGAAFDFLSGRTKEAPALLHGSGFEWTYRLVSEPRRLWRRYLVDSPRFVARAMTERRRS